LAAVFYWHCSVYGHVHHCPAFWPAVPILFIIVRVVAMSLDDFDGVERLCFTLDQGMKRLRFTLDPTDGKTIYDTFYFIYKQQFM